MQIEVIIAIAGCMFTTMGLNIAIFSWLRSDIKELEAKMDRKFDKVLGELAEMRSQIGRQDADFKAHITYCHKTG